MRRTVQHGILVTAALLAVTSPAGAKEGFGFLLKKVASMVRVSPPAVYLLGTKFQVQVSSSGTVGGDLTGRLKSQLESALIGRDSRLMVETNRPETSIEVTLLQNDKSERWEDRQESTLVQTGTNSKGKPVYGTREVTVRYKVVTHAFAVSYKVTDRTKGLSLDANSLHFDFSQSYRDGTNAPEMFALESSAIGNAVDAIARRITPTRETVGVLLPKGSLEDAANLAVAGQWNLYLEALEKRSPSAQPVDESYRQYAMGVAYEAVGYASEDPAETLKYLEQASVYYNKAIEANPGEKYFAQAYDSRLTGKAAMAPLARVQTALTNYRKIKDFQAQYAGLQAAAQGDIGGTKALDAKAQEMNNAAVIRMTRAGLPNGVILTAVETAAKPSFDISPQGLIALSEAQVDKAVIQRLQEVATGKKARPAKPMSKKTHGAGKPASQP
jgi:hypothetical protein